MRHVHDEHTRGLTVKRRAVSSDHMSSVSDAATSREHIIRMLWNIQFKTGNLLGDNCANHDQLNWKMGKTKLTCMSLERVT